MWFFGGARFSVCISSCCVHSVHASVPDAHAHQHVLKGPFQIYNFYAYAEHMHKNLMLMLRVCISSYPNAGYVSVPDAYAQHILKGLRSVHALVPKTYAQCTHQFLTHLLSVRVSSWWACSVHTSVPYAHAEGTQNEHWKIGKLRCVLSMGVSNWWVWR